MTKRWVLLAILVTLVTTGAFAQMSAGVGVFYNADIGGSGANLSVPGFGSVLDYEAKHNGFGIYGYFDAAYIELSLGTLWGIYKRSLGGSEELEEYFYSEEFRLQSLHLGLLGKFPIQLSNNLTLFPAVGIDYQMYSSLKQGNTIYTNAGDFSSLWFRFGGGVDVGINESMYFRGTILYGIKLNSKYDKETEDDFNFIKNYLGVGSVEYKKAHGLQIKAAIGFKF